MVRVKKRVLLSGRIRTPGKRRTQVTEDPTGGMKKESPGGHPKGKGVQNKKHVGGHPTQKESGAVQYLD